MKLIPILIIAITLIQCGSSKFVDNPPFSIDSAYYTNWVGGQRGVSGTNVVFNYSANQTIVFDSIYFKNRVEKLQDKSSNNQKIIVGYFSNPKKGVLIIDKNPTKEVNNKPPNLERNKFILKENEAVISYKEGAKTKYFKITSLEKKEQEQLPSLRKPNNINKIH